MPLCTSTSARLQIRKTEPANMQASVLVEIGDLIHPPKNVLQICNSLILVSLTLGRELFVDLGGLNY